jgi:hypothetical protein
VFTALALDPKLFIEIMGSFRRFAMFPTLHWTVFDFLRFAGERLIVATLMFSSPVQWMTARRMLVSYLGFPIIISTYRG